MSEQKKSASASNSGSQSAQNYRLPSVKTLNHAIKLAIVEDKPIMMDYWVPSLEKKALIGVRTNVERSGGESEKLLVKSEDEYTSSIQKFYKTDDEYIIPTENSIYIVSNEIPTKKIM